MNDQQTKKSDERGDILVENQEIIRKQKFIIPEAIKINQGMIERQLHHALRTPNDNGFQTREVAQQRAIAGLGCMLGPGCTVESNFAPIPCVEHASMLVNSLPIFTPIQQSVRIVIF